MRRLVAIALCTCVTACPKKAADKPDVQTIAVANEPTVDAAPAPSEAAVAPPIDVPDASDASTKLASKPAGMTAAQREQLALEAEQMKMLAVLGGGTASVAIPPPPPPTSATSDVSIGATSATVAVPNADRVIAGLRPGFRQCHNRGLQDIDPTMAGKMEITVKVAPNGDVAAADATLTNLGPAVTTCVVKKIRSASFDAPGGSGSTIQIPLTFVIRK